MVSSTAISGFRRIHERFITSEVTEAMLRIFHQNKVNYDSSVRIAALELILDNQPSEQVIRNILLSSLDQSNVEFSTYVVRMLLDYANANPSLSSKLSSVLQELWINNYNIFSQKGKSSVITSYLAQMKDLNGTYSLYFENTPSGVMKQSGMIVSLQGKTIQQPIMKFGIYADGLESLIGEAGGEAPNADENVAEGENDSTVEPTAGMSFTFMDVLLTQVEFFRGMSGLMSAAWNAPSELTSALQGNLLLQDHSQRIHLSNGLVLDTKVLGALSLDLSGYISISLWNRNCEALIRNSGAVYLEGTLSVDSTELDVGLVFTGQGESYIDYTSNADFYEMPLKLCMQMKRPDFEFTHTVDKYEELLKGKKYTSHRSLKSKVSGEEYLLNKANSDECRVMLKEDQ
uniref:MTP large subunit lipid-binding domain-containing protein n=1 Tax=Arion vulgaris TaxID=1028688 RepID=A0A0B6ZQ93_9EUPU